MGRWDSGWGGEGGIPGGVGEVGFRLGRGRWDSRWGEEMGFWVGWERWDSGWGGRWDFGWGGGGGIPGGEREVGFRVGRMKGRRV